MTPALSQRIRGWLRSANTLRRHGRPEIMLSFLGGLGDDLLCTAPIHEWLQRGVRNLWFVSRYPSLHRFDSRVHVFPEDPAIFSLARRLGSAPRFLSYSTFDPATDRDTPLTRHMIVEMCARAGLSGTVALRPSLSLTKDELATAAFAENTIVVQAAGLDAAVPMGNKQWPPERMQHLVTALAASHTILQIGSSRDPSLVGARDLRGKTSLRETAALLARARLFVGLVGFPMHLARAVDCPSVVIFGGREPPSFTGYVCNQNLAHTPACSPCWQRNRCDHSRICLSDISTDSALTAIHAALAGSRGPLATETAEVTPFV